MPLDKPVYLSPAKLIRGVRPDGRLRNVYPREAQELYDSLWVFQDLQMFGARDVRDSFYGLDRLPLACPECLTVRFMSRIPFPVYTCRNCGCSRATTQVLAVTADGFMAAYYGYRYGQASERQPKKKFKLVFTDLSLILAVVFVVEIMKGFAAQAGADLYQKVKDALHPKLEWLRKRAETESLDGSPYSTKDLDKVLASDVEFNDFVKRVVDSLVNRRRGRKS